MRLKKPAALSASEWKIMKILWEKKSCAARDVFETAGKQHGWAISTVKTLLRRLVDKGYLQTTQVGNSYLYKPTQNAFKMLCRYADSLLDHALEGTVAPLLAYMVNKSDLSSDEISQLRSLLEEYKPSREE
jgi:BlaI family transcriptional regulator, penicillinase repressor